MALNLYIGKGAWQIDPSLITTLGDWVYEGTIPELSLVLPGTFWAQNNDPRQAKRILIHSIDENGQDRSGLLAGLSAPQVIVITHTGILPNNVTKFEITSSQHINSPDSWLYNVKNIEYNHDLQIGWEYLLEAIPLPADRLLRADLYPDEGLTLNRQILTDTGIDNSNKQFTRDFNIPATSNNNELLNHWELKSNESITNPNQAIPALIEIDDVYAINGSIELLSVTWKKRQPESYRMVFYGEVSNIKALLGETLLEDIDWSAFEFLWSQAKVTDSWIQNSSNYFIPIIAFKRWYEWYPDLPEFADKDLYPNNIHGLNQGVLLSELRVGLNLKEMLQAIGSYVGQSFVFDTKINDYLAEVFCLPSRFEDQTLTLSPELYETDVQTSTANILVLTQDIPQIADMEQVNSDPRGNYNAATFTYTPEFSGSYTFRLTFEILTVNGNRPFTGILYEGGATTGLEAGTSLGQGDTGSVNLTYNCTAGLAYTFFVECTQDATLYVRMFTQNVPISRIGTSYDPGLNMPVVKASDFISGFLKTFNLLMYQSDLNEFTISDMHSLFNLDGISVDLEDYVNELALTYEKVSVYDRINLKHKSGKDAPNLLFSDVSGREYAEIDYLPDVDFSRGSLEHESIFSVFPPGYINEYDVSGEKGRTDLWTHFQLSNDAPPKPVLADFLLMYRNGVAPTSFFYYLQDSVDTDGTPLYGLQLECGRYSQVQDFSTLDIKKTLSYSREDSFIGEPAEGTITNEFWTDWLLQVYKRTAYTLMLTFPANFGIYLKVNALSVIFLNGFYHFLASHSYNSATNMLTLKLLRADELLPATKAEKDGILKLYGI